MNALAVAVIWQLVIHVKALAETGLPAMDVMELVQNGMSVGSVMELD